MLLVTADTLRADSLGVYGAAPGRTPQLDRFAAGATVFERAAAPMPLTRPSHFSILTGLYPREHGVVNNALALPDAAETLPELLRARGYRTGAFVGVRLLGPASGAAQGFEVFEPPATREQTADTVVPRALAWVQSLPGDEPFFLWVHLFDPHLPYAPPPGYGPRRHPRLAGELPRIDWEALEAEAADNGDDVPVYVLEHARALYAGEVAYLDHWFGELLAGVEAARSGEPLLSVFTADHGESFEHGVYFEHADSLGEGAIRVPLIVRFPGGTGERVGGQASSIDVAPTILRALGQPLPDRASGRPLQEREGLAQRQVLIQLPLYSPRAALQRPQRYRIIRSVGGMPVAPIVVGEERAGLVGDGWKYLRGAGLEALHRLGPEGSEAENLADREPERRRELAERLDQALREHPLTILVPGEINEELRANLEALGYAY